MKKEMEMSPYADEELIKQWPGFVNRYATVNGVKLHFVEGGAGEPLVCLPGWPQTWFSFHTIAPELAKNYHLIIVDIRGMGSSDKPASGYDKKNMAKDVYELIRELGHDKVNLLGHDIGGMVAMSFAFNYPEATQKLIVMDGAHPGDGIMHMPLIPASGTFTTKMDGDAPYAWWMGFNQVKELPEKILEGRFQYLLDWLIFYVMIDDSKMTAFDRGVYASVYNDADSIRASNAWYQTFTQDIEDAKTYPMLEMPVLAIGSYISFSYMKMGLPYVAKDITITGVLDSGHYLTEERPDAVITIVAEFLAAN